MTPFLGETEIKEKEVESPADILARMDERQAGDTSTLKRIERNTGILSELIKVTTAAGKLAKETTAAIKISTKSQLTSKQPRKKVKQVSESIQKSVIEQPASTSATRKERVATPTAEPPPLQRDIATAPTAPARQRNDKGQFGGKKTSSAEPAPAGSGLLFILAKAVKGKVKENKSDLKEAAGRSILGGGWDAVQQAMEGYSTLKEKMSKDEGLFSELKGWGKEKTAGIKGKLGLGNKKDATTKAVEKTEKAEIKRHREILQALEKTGSRSSGGGDGGGIIDTAIGTATGALLAKGKGILSGAGTAVGGAASKAGGLLSKIPGAGILGKAAGAVGGKIPIIGGLITAGTTLATGGSKKEAAGAGIGAVAGGALGSFAGPVGAVVGSMAGAWIGKKLGGLFTDQNKAQIDNQKKEQKLLDAQGGQQDSFWGKFSSIPLLGGMIEGAKNAVDSAGSAYSLSREKGGGFIESATAAAKGAFRASKGKAAEREKTLEQAAVASGMTDPKELAMFMGQAKHETAGFSTMQEYASGAAYEGRKDLGNTQAGDGKKFKGRGYFQLTGRANYADMSKKLGMDLENNPELAEDPQVASKIALQYWKDKKLDQASKAGDFDKVTKRINGGTNGYEDRLKQTQGYNTKYANGVPGAQNQGNQAADAARAKFIADEMATPSPQVAVSQTKKSAKPLEQTSTDIYNKRRTAPPVQLAKAVPSVSVPEPKPLQSPPPAPVTANVPGMDRLVTAMADKSAPKKDAKGAKGTEGQDIKTEFDSTLLTLMVYDRI